MKEFISLAATLFVAAGAVCAQETVRIIDHLAMEVHPNMSEDRAALAGMQAAGLDPGSVASVIRSTEDHPLPDGLRTDSARMANRLYFRYYKAHRLCEYATEYGMQSIVTVPAAENQHMPEDLRSDSDLVFVIRSEGLENAPDAPAPLPPSRGPGWKALPHAKILKADAVYATYDLASDTVLTGLLEKKGLSQPEIDAVVFRAHERNWPEGIDSFDERYPRLEKVKRYKVRELAHWKDKVLVVVPAELNKKLPATLRPYMDIYLVYNRSAVKVKEPKARK